MALANVDGRGVCLYVSNEGEKRSVSVPVPTGKTASNVATFYSALSTYTNAAIQAVECVLKQEEATNQYGTLATYAQIESYGLVNLLSSTGEKVAVRIPCPALALFEDDQETVDATAGAAVATAYQTLYGGTWTYNPVGSRYHWNKKEYKETRDAQ